MSNKIKFLKLSKFCKLNELYVKIKFKADSFSFTFNAEISHLTSNNSIIDLDINPISCTQKLHKPKCKYQFFVFTLGTAEAACCIIVSIDVNHTFKVIFTRLEYIPSIPPLPFYVINICLYVARMLHFFGSRFYKPLISIKLGTLCCY